MPHKLDNLERQLKTAREALAQCTSKLESLGKSTKECRKDPNWRRLNARCRKLANRQKAAQAVVTLTEEAQARRAEKANAE
ncbi:MAG: hypothetical protein Tsb009_32890 [Planctomycetaceae bacterium]